MIWTEFLKVLATSPSVDIVGPFASRWKPTGGRPVIFVDSGVRWRASGLDLLSAVVGDGDSATGVTMDALLDRAKDFSDFAFALRSLPQNISSIHAHGFLGERRDHELANLGEAHHFLSTRLRDTEMYFDDSVQAFSAGEWKFQRAGIFSVFVLEKCSVMITGAAQFPIPAPVDLSALSSFGLSNVGNGEIHVSCSGPAFVLNAEN